MVQDNRVLCIVIESASVREQFPFSPLHILRLSLYTAFIPLEALKTLSFKSIY